MHHLVTDKSFLGACNPTPNTANELSITGVYHLVQGRVSPSIAACHPGTKTDVWDKGTRRWGTRKCHDGNLGSDLNVLKSNFGLQQCPWSRDPKGSSGLGCPLGTLLRLPWLPPTVRRLVVAMHHSRAGGGCRRHSLATWLVVGAPGTCWPPVPTPRRPTQPRDPQGLS